MIDRTIFTPRELEVYKYILRGYTIPQTASFMHVTPATVSTWRQNIFHKVLMNSQPEIMANRIAELEGTLEAVRQLLVSNSAKAVQDAISMIRNTKL